MAHAPGTDVVVEDPAPGACSERQFFQERDEALGIVAALVARPDAGPADPDFAHQHARLVTILDRYLEQSHLLDPHLPGLAAPLVAEIQRMIAAFATAERHAPETAFPRQLYANPRLHGLFQLVYHLCRVRGYKTIVRLLPHEARDFEPTLRLLQSQDRADHATWETRYVLLLWLSMLCLVPFDLATIDSSQDDAALVTNVVTLCRSFLADPGATQLAAAVCLGRLLSRPDVEAQALERFLRWADAELARAHSAPDTRQLQVTGIMRTLAYVAKHAPRARHAHDSRIYFASLLQLIARLTDDGAASSTLHRKLSVKLVQRLGLLYLPPRVQSWRYQRGLRSLELNMQLQPQQQQLQAQSEPVVASREDDDDGDDDVIPATAIEELEQIVDVLLTGLRDKDTVVRWSAAKGIGRLTGRLPFAYADDVVQSVMELFVATEGEGAWHGASLALAELARRGVLLPMRLTEAVDCVARALQYDLRRGAHSIGAHVRDAACYACWSFARAYEPQLLRPHLQETLAPAMLINCVFDRELNCRRAASAAFQENVGRQGRANFPNGINLLTRADYSSVANLRHAFLDVSAFVAQYPEYRYALLEHLLARKVGHWDGHIRTLAAKALGRITALDPIHVQRVALPRLMLTALASDVEVLVRQGALLAIGESLLALVRAPSFVDGELQTQLKALPIEIEKRRLFRGRGGEMIRVAVCGLIEVMAIAGFSLSLVMVKKYLGVLEDGLGHAVESVRNAAIDAFAAFTRQYCPRMLERGTPVVRQFLSCLVPRFLSNGLLAKVPSGNGTGDLIVLNPNVAVRRGFSRAIGVAAKELLQPTLAECLQTLFRAASIGRQSRDEQDAESRVAAIRAITDICTRAQYDDLDLSGLEEDAVRVLITSIHDDYGVDERGDVGSWVRKEAMIGLDRLLRGVLPSDLALSSDLVGSLVRTRYGPGRIVRVVGVRRNGGDPGEDAVEGPVDPVCHVQFSPPSLGFYYFAGTGIGCIRRGQLEQVSGASEDKLFHIPTVADRMELVRMASRQRRTPLAFHKRVPPTLTADVFCALVKQLAEKLDNVRLIAGQILFQLLHSCSPRIDGIPDRFQLEKVIFPQSVSVNWSMAHDTFPLVVRMMDIPDYFEAVAAGLVVSVGGLTESVVKASKAALFAWFRSHLAAKDFGLLSRFSFFMVTLMIRHQHDDRITIPLMKTLASLLEEGFFNFLFETCNHDETSNEAATTEFGERLYAALKDELQTCLSIPKLAAGIAVLIGLLPSEPQTQGKALRALVLFLAHRFPNVRKLTAEKLYTRLLIHEDVVSPEQYDAVVDILSCTAWDGSVADARKARNELLGVLGMAIPVKKSRVEVSGSQDQEELTSSAESYKNLVKEMGY